MNKLHLTTQFKKDVKKAKRRGKDTAKLQEVIEKIATGTSLDPRHKPHRLAGQWAPSWECHVEPDWLLIWNDEGPEEIIFLRTGTHSDLFKKL